MVDVLKAFLEECRYVMDDLEHLPEGEQQFWRDRVVSALPEIDDDAFHRRDRAVFAASIEAARARLLPDTAAFEKQLEVGRKILETLDGLIAHGRNQGLDLSYARSTARTIRSFLDYARDDMADGEFKHAVRAVRTAEWMCREGNEAVTMVKSILSDPSQDRVVPRYETGPIEIREGAFFQKKRPLIFTGVGHFSQVRKDVPILNEYGLNMIQIDTGPQSALPHPDKVDTTSTQRSVVDVLDNAAAHDVMVNLLLAPHYFPKWAFEENPDLGRCGDGFIKFCVDEEGARAVIEKWLRVLMPMVANHPALHSICLSNEPQYKACWELSRERFIAWIQEQHGDIEAVNEKWGTNFASFEELPEPSRDCYPLYYDWCRYTQNVFLEFHQFEAALVHEYDPDIPVHVKVRPLAFSDHDSFERGMDFDGFTHLGTIAGNDCYQNYQPFESGPYLQHWDVMAMMYTLQRSMTPGKPIYNSEDHVVQDFSTHFIPAAHIRNAFWMQAIHGQGAATTWVWERNQHGDLGGNILTRINCVAAIGSIGLDLLRLAPEVHALQQTPSRAAILFSEASRLPDMTYANAARDCFKGGYFTDTVWSFITERQAMEGGLDAYRLVVVPEAVYAPQKVVQAFQDYISEGGTVITSGAAFTKDPWGKALPLQLKEQGDGRLVRYPSLPDEYAWRSILNQQLEEAGVLRPFRLTGTHSEAVWGVNLRAVRYKKGWLLNLVNLSREAQTVLVQGGRPIREAVNLFTGEKVSFPLQLEVLEPVLLRVYNGR